MKEAVGVARFHLAKLQRNDKIRRSGTRKGPEIWHSMFGRGGG